MIPAAIEIQHLTKAFGSVSALEDVTLTVPTGSVFGLVGRNGAGKSTTLNLLVGLLRPDSGSATIEGHSVFTNGGLARASVGYVPESAGIYPWLTGVEATQFWRRLSGTWNEQAFRRCIDMLDLPMNRPVAALSKGMRTQLLLALAIGKQPRVYILDEPTSGLDPVVRRQVLRLLRHERERGCTVLISSHMLAELDDICTHVAVLHRGLVKASSTLTGLREQWRKYHFSYDGVLDDVFRAARLTNYERRGHTYTLCAGGNHDEVERLLRALPVQGLHAEEMHLEEIFFDLIGGETGPPVSEDTELPARL